MSCCRMLSVWDRAAMIVGLEAGLSQVRIADRVGRSPCPSVVCREIARHTGALMVHTRPRTPGERRGWPGQCVHDPDSAPPASKDIQERIVSDLEAKLRRVDEAESATSETLGRLTDLRNLCMENSLYPRECTIA